MKTFAVFITMPNSMYDVSFVANKKYTQKNNAAKNFRCKKMQQKNFVVKKYTENFLL